MIENPSKYVTLTDGIMYNIEHCEDPVFFHLFENLFLKGT
jgi:hypothetical protein